MPDVVWGGMQRDQAVAQCSTMGSLPGPGGDDGWTKFASLPRTKLQASRHYAFIVSGTLRNIEVIGGTPNRGLCQIVLGDDSGVRSPLQCFELGANWPAIATGGVPFQFLVMFADDYGITEPAWGASWPNTQDLSLYARTFWNGDAPTYAVSFQIWGVTWVWIDLDNLPAASRYFASEHAPASPILQVTATPGTWTDHFIGAADPGSAGEEWVHFFNLQFQPLVDYPTGVAKFQHCVSTNGSMGVSFTPRIGAGAAGRPGSWGCSSRGAPFSAAHRNPRMHFGCFANRTRPSGSQYWGYRGNGDALIHRWRHFALRIDELPEVSQLSVTDRPSTPGPSNNEPNPVTIVHEPPPQNGAVAQPIILASGQAFTDQAGFHAHRLQLITRRGRMIWDGPGVDMLNGEGVPIFAADQFGLGRSDDDGVRYENKLLQARPDSPGFLFYADDFEFCQLWLVQDPTIEPPEPFPSGPPVILIPSREGVAIAAQNALPVEPVWAEEDPETPRGEIRGATGVRRTWPLFTGPRRTWSISWPALTNAQKLTLEAFLRANPTFKARPPHETSDVALLSLETAQFDMIDPANWIWTSKARVSELVFVGGA